MVWLVVRFKIKQDGLMLCGYMCVFMSMNVCVCFSMDVCVGLTMCVFMWWIELYGGLAYLIVAKCHQGHREQVTSLSTLQCNVLGGHFSAIISARLKWIV